MTFTPADPESMKGIRKAIQDIKLHDHEREDWFCMDLNSWLGGRSGWLVVRLDEAYAEIERLREEPPTWAAQRAALIELHPYDELIFGGFYCMRCSDGPEGPDELTPWPCASLRAVGVTDTEAIEIIKARRAAIEAKTVRDAGA